MASEPRHSVSVAGVVVNPAGQVLIIRRRDNGHWEPPGGVLELGESLEDGIQREVLEETGVHVAVDRLTGVYKNMARGIVSLVFRCTPTDFPAPETAEATEIRWQDPDAIPHLMSPAFAVRVQDAFTDGTTIRSHDGTNLLTA